MPISLPLACYHSVEVDCTPRAAGRYPRSDRPQILLLSDRPEEHRKAFPANRENLRLRLSEMENLFCDRADDYPWNHITKFTHPQTLLGHRVHNDRRRPISCKPPILSLSLANRRAEKFMPSDGTKIIAPANKKDLPSQKNLLRTLKSLHFRL